MTAVWDDTKGVRFPVALPHLRSLNIIMKRSQCIISGLTSLERLYVQHANYCSAPYDPSPVIKENRLRRLKITGWFPDTNLDWSGFTSLRSLGVQISFHPNIFPMKNLPPNLRSLKVQGAHFRDVIPMLQNHKELRKLKIYSNDAKILPRQKVILPPTVDVLDIYDRLLEEFFFHSDHLKEVKLHSTTDSKVDLSSMVSITRVSIIVHSNDEREILTLISAAIFPTSMLHFTINLQEKTKIYESLFRYHWHKRHPDVIMNLVYSA
jgi:hypothetical protein